MIPAGLALWGALNAVKLEGGYPEMVTTIAHLVLPHSYGSYFTPQSVNQRL
jgi:hypothetical protein